VREAAEGLGAIAWSFANPPPRTPLNVPIGPHRRVLWLRFPLADLKEIKNKLGGTVNDVFLATVSGALARWLKRRGVRTEGLELRGIVPVSIRGDEQQGALGNRITAMLGPLPVYANDPVDRLRIVSEAMKGLKESKQAVGAETLTRLQDFAPPTILAQASRLNFSTRAYNLLVTNVPGPQFPLYLIGRELEELAPVPFLAPERALAVAIMSYNGNVDIGLMGDYDAMADLDSFGVDIEESIAELLAAARAADAREEAPAPAQG
jgi:WS/DGAT/MGAT family acyltransferase